MPVIWMSSALTFSCSCYKRMLFWFKIYEKSQDIYMNDFCTKLSLHEYRKINLSSFEVGTIYLLFHPYHLPWWYNLGMSLSHLPLDKMATILADDNFKCIFLNENDRIPIRISLKFVPRRPIDNKPVLVQVTACRRTGDKPLLELMLTHFTDANMRHQERWVILYISVI